MKNSIILTLIFSSAIYSCETKTDKDFIKTEEATTEHKDSTIQKEPINSSDTNIIDTHNAKTSIDWVGTYEGILPCADCPGIKTTVTLNKDETIKVVSEYMKGNQKLIDEGHFQWTADNNALYLDTKDKNRHFYRVGENKLIILSQEGEDIKGPLADKYILLKK